MVRTVLIIGGSGFVGTHLAQSLREGYKVFGPRMVLYRGQRRAVVEGTPSERSHPVKRRPTRRSA